MKNHHVIHVEATQKSRRLHAIIKAGDVFVFFFFVSGPPRPTTAFWQFVTVDRIEMIIFLKTFR